MAAGCEYFEISFFYRWNFKWWEREKSTKWIILVNCGKIPCPGRNSFRENMAYSIYIMYIILAMVRGSNILSFALGYVIHVTIAPIHCPRVTIR